LTVAEITITITITPYEIDIDNMKPGIVIFLLLRRAVVQLMQ